MNVSQTHRPSKRRKYDPKTNSSTRAKPLTATTKRLEDDAEKDDEERRLESLLFGAAFPVSSDKGIQKALNKDAQMLVESSGFDLIADPELFVADFPDDDLQAASKDESDQEKVESHSSSESDSDSNSDAEGEHKNQPSSSKPTASAIPPAWTKSRASTAKTSAWEDHSDAAVTISLKNDKRLRKLRETPEDDKIGGRRYEANLRQQFEKLNPTPAWADSAREKLRNRNSKQKRRRSVSSTQSTSDDERDVEDLLHSTGSIIKGERRSTLLPPTKLDILGLRDANQTGRLESEVGSVRFHPSPTVPVLLTAGSDRRLRLFNIDGLTNPILQTIHTPTLPITNAQFHPSGQSVLLTGARPYFVTYDLQSGSTMESPRGLWSSSSVTEDGKAQGDRSMEIAKFSDDGKLLAVGGRGGYVHLLQCGSGGSGA
ncbi:hypothetical protein FRB90_004163, partial [Tulasnella sp. 427]